MEKPTNEIVIYSGAPIEAVSAKEYIVLAAIKKAPDVITIQGIYVDETGEKNKKEIDLTKKIIYKLYTEYCNKD